MDGTAPRRSTRLASRSPALEPDISQVDDVDEAGARPSRLRSKRGRSTAQQAAAAAGDSSDAVDDDMSCAESDSEEEDEDFEALCQAEEEEAAGRRASNAEAGPGPGSYTGSYTG